jgi:hypothetical protein
MDGRIKRLLAIALLCAGLTLPARAQDAPSAEALRAAQDLAAVMTADTIQQMSAAMIGQMWPSIESQLGGKVDAATLAEMRSEFVGIATSFTGDMMKEAPAVYARNFSVQELRDLLAFYKSPAGAKALHIMPKVMADIATQMAPRMQGFQRDLVARMQTIMEKHGYKN